MPIVRLKDIVDMDSKERRKKLSELRTEQSRLRTMISAGGAVENPARIREIRKAIARILTVENQQKKTAKTPEKSVVAKEGKKEKSKQDGGKSKKVDTKEKKKE
jgi:large subunit ribosomal protein L29